MSIKLCQWCREVRFEGGCYWCSLQQRDFPDADQCARYQPDSGPEAISDVVHAESGIHPVWLGIALANCKQ